MGSQYEVLNPWADVEPIPLRGISPRLKDLGGKKIGLLVNGKRASRPIMSVIERKLRQRFPSATFSYSTPTGNREIVEGPEQGRFEDWAKGVDAVVAAVGDWGSCTKYLVYNTISIESLHKPAVALVNQGFANDARSAASGREMPGIRLVSESIVPECNVMEQVEAGISPDVINGIVAGLTRPLTREEEMPVKEVAKPPRTVFKGNLEEVNLFFYKSGWSDGLPIMPPTEETVAQMLTGTDLPPDHVVAKIIPRLGKATIEKIAINAVMAGALPTYMPLLITAIQTIMEPRAHFGTYEVSNGSWAPCCLINGPIRNDLHINSSSGAMSPGNIANATIGRALGLIIKNIGGARPGIEDMGALGNPMKYSLVIAENEEESPWEPLHIQEGFHTGDSALTVFYPNSLVQVGAYGTDDDGLLRTAAYNIPPGRAGLICILIRPQHAKILASKGWTKKEIMSFICEYARTPLSHHSGYWESHGRQEKLFLKSPKDSPHESVRIVSSPEWLRVFCAGGAGNQVGMLMAGHTVGVTGWVTKKVELPKNWDKLVEKYKDIVPTYIKY